MFEQKLDGISLGVEEWFVFASFYLGWIRRGELARKESARKYIDVWFIRVFPPPLDACVRGRFQRDLSSIASGAKFPS